MCNSVANTEPFAPTYCEKGQQCVRRLLPLKAAGAVSALECNAVDGPLPFISTAVPCRAVGRGGLSGDGFFFCQGPPLGTARGTINRQPPTAANHHQPPPTATTRHQPPVANRQPPTAHRQHMVCPRAFLEKLCNGTLSFFFPVKDRPGRRVEGGACCCAEIVLAEGTSRGVWSGAADASAAVQALPKAWRAGGVGGCQRATVSCGGAVGFGPFPRARYCCCGGVEPR